MKKLIALTLIVIIAVTGFVFRDDLAKAINQLKVKYSDQKILREEPKLLREFPPKQVEIFDLEEQRAILTFQKTGTSASSSTSYVTPQLSGQIEKLKVEVGDSVDKDEIIAVLGSSLSTDIAELQYESAKDSLNILLELEKLTHQSSSQTVKSAKIATDIAEEALKNAKTSKNNTAELFDEQIEATKLGIEQAEESLDNTQRQLEDAEDKLDDLKDQEDDLEDEIDDLEDLEPTPENLAKIAALEQALTELETAIETLESQVDQLEFAETSSKLAVEQAESGLDQLKTTKTSQLDQLDFAINSAKEQLALSENSENSAATGSALQEKNLEAQILQAQNGLKTASLNLEQKFIKAPISGKVTQISIEEDTMVGPGQAIMKIENTSQITIKSSLNLNEAKLVKLGENVLIKYNDDAFVGKITSISPSLNEMTKKIDIEIEPVDKLNLTPGAFVKIGFSLKPTERIFVPINSVFLDGKTKYVKTVSDKNKVIFTEIETSEIIGSYIEVTKGITGTEKIIVSSDAGFLKEKERVAINL